MIRFSRYIGIYFAISLCVLVPGMYSLLRFGLQPSIDFSGGTIVEVSFTPFVDQSVVNIAAESQNITISSIQPVGENGYLLRTNDDAGEKISKLMKHIEVSSSVSSQLLRQESVGPVLGQELLMKAFIAAVVAITAILLYVAYAFGNVSFGIAAVVALFHDLFVILGMFSLFGKWFGVEVDTLFVTAFLTTMSFSVHDTIVILDRIREYQKKGGGYSFDEICDRALTETMGRSITNSMTIVLMLVAMILMGGDSVRWFGVALLIGTISGTYSSPFVATPVLLVLKKWKKRR